jgi:hypothetical protein
MAVLIRYQPSSLTRAQYDQANATLGGPGEMPPALLLHVLFGEEPNLRVSEIWESEAAWREMWDGALGEALADANIEFASDPELFSVHEFVGSALSE